MFKLVVVRIGCCLVVVWWGCSLWDAGRLYVSERQIVYLNCPAPPTEKGVEGWEGEQISIPTASQFRAITMGGKCVLAYVARANGWTRDKRNGAESHVKKFNGDGREKR